MGQPVKLSDSLIDNARVAGAILQRSITGQVEHWARLGMWLEPLLEGRKVQSLLSTPIRPLSELLSTVGTPEGNQRVMDYLKSKPYPHFEPHPAGNGLLVRVEADGSQTIGRFHGREFRKEKPAGKLRPGSR